MEAEQAKETAEQRRERAERLLAGSQIERGVRLLNEGNRLGLLDRLTHRVHILEVNGPSYRLMESKKKRKHPRWQSDSSSDRMDEDQPTDSE